MRALMCIAFSFGFDAFSSCEPDPASLENAVLDLTRFLHANRIPLRSKTLCWV
jgi:hypothetical protein